MTKGRPAMTKGRPAMTPSVIPGLIRDLSEMCKKAGFCTFWCQFLYQNVRLGRFCTFVHHSRMYEWDCGSGPAMTKAGARNDGISVMLNSFQHLPLQGTPAQVRGDGGQAHNDGSIGF